MQGHSVTLLRIFPYAAIKYMAYDQVHYLLMPTRQSETNIRRFAAGSISGMVRLAFLTKSSDQQNFTLYRSFKQIYHEQAIQRSSHDMPGLASRYLNRFPILKFYRGFSATIAGMTPYAGVSFLSWGYLRARFLPAPDNGKTKPTPMADLSIGAVSGAIAQTTSYPFEVIRRRMQVGGITHPDRWLRWGETIRAIYATSGWRGFYVGLSIGYVKVIPMTAVSFTVWQGGKRLLGV
ncbi:hypothetical protein D9757_005620 [Collybiopsis confluens]|uniref:Mitochondrial carrier protein n=1 Tax=Collybiopsis confluens TaxID=2823264 RepID=A0A8H5HSR3_9AGAR|nr:hypothetical protein D9757_005620 [Collybiopsis confluens]